MSLEKEQSFQNISSFGENLLESSLQKYNNEINHQQSIPKTFMKKNFKGCPVKFIFPNDPLSTVFIPHYELGLIFHPYDFIFDKMNYLNEDLLNESKIIRGYPRHLRNTLFVRGDKVKMIRKKDFNSIFTIGENLKEKADELYQQEDYYEALSQYNLIYSLYKWIEFKDKKKELLIFSNLAEIRNNPIVDDDVILKNVTIKKKEKNDKATYNKGILGLLKAMSYCYIHLRAYSEAIKCLDEALEFCDDKIPDIYFRRAQARMYNKYSTMKELYQAMNDFIQARSRNSEEKTIDDQYNFLLKMIKKKENSQIEKIQSKKFYYKFNRTSA